MNRVRPIQAYSLADFQAITSGQPAEFRRGKDKQKRKRRDTAAMVGGGLAAAGTLGAGVRYGGAAISAARSKSKRFGGRSQAGQMNLDKAATKGGARGLLKEDMNKIFGAKSQRGQMARDKVGQTIRNVTTNARMLARDGSANVVSGAKKVLGTRGGKIGAGLAAVAALGGAGYGASRMMKNRKKKK